MAYRGGRGGGASGGGGPRLSNSSASSNMSGNNSSVNTGRNRGGGQSSGPRGWGSPSPQLNGSTPRQQQHQQQQHNNSQNASAAAAVTAFPSLGKASGPASGSHNADNSSQAKMKDRVNFVILSLVGNTVTVKTQSGPKYVGILHSTTIEGSELGVALTYAQELKGDGSLGSPIPSLVIKGPELNGVEASEVTLGEPVKATSDGFRTDVEISARGGPDPFGEGRTLQKWSDDPGLAALDSGLETSFAAGNNATNGSGSSGGAWDQFAANEARFGIKSNYEETMYTTKLDRSGKDFKEREKRAEKLAAEIMGSASANPHIQEERGQAAADDSGQNEEDKYGAVVRGPNAYVPPAARRAAEAAAAAGKGAKDAKSTTDGAALQATPPAAIVNTASVLVEPPSEQAATPGIAIKVPTPTGGTAPSATAEAFVPAQAAPTGTSASANNEKLTSDFRHFVSSERQRILREKQNALAGAQAKAEREKQAKLAELKNWSSSFKLKTPMPEDVAEVIHKSTAGEKPRDPSLVKSMSPTTAHTQTTGAASAGRAGGGAAGGAASVVTSPAGGAGAASATSLAPKTANVATSTVNKSTNAQLAETKAILSKMTIPKIPPFNSEKAKARQAAAAAAAKGVAAGTSSDKPTAPLQGVPVISPTAGSSAAAPRMSAKASSFKPFNPAAAAFTPGGGAGGPPTLPASAAPPTAVKQFSPAASASVAAPVLAAPPHSANAVSTASSMAVQASNPFFGTKVLKKSTHPIHIREDFTPFKPGKVAESTTITPSWPYTGKSYRQIFSAVASPMSGGPQLGLPGSLGEDGLAHQGAGGVHPGSSVPSTPASQHSAGPHHPGVHHPQQAGQPGQMGISSSQSSGVPLNMMVPGTPAAGSAAPPHAPSPYGMVYQPQPGGPGPYRFPQGQYVVQGGMPMVPPPGSAGAMPYGAGIPLQYGQQNGHPHHLAQGGPQHHMHGQHHQGAGQPIHIQQMHFQGQGVPPYQQLYSPQLGNMQAAPAQYLPMAAPPASGASAPAGPSTPRLGTSSSGPASNSGGNVPTGPAVTNNSAAGGGKGPASLPQAPPPSAGGMYYPPGVQQPGSGPVQYGSAPPGVPGAAGFIPQQGPPHGAQGMQGGPRQHYQPHHQQSHHLHQQQHFQQQQHHQQGYGQQQQHHGGGGHGFGGHAPPPQQQGHNQQPSGQGQGQGQQASAAQGQAAKSDAGKASAKE
ncbi:hypothetical protein BCV69DRAFT_21047 [Microstroma glucosiphilum]|uniref:LsmAD domain-containing protein n=1 Tax=Pseudomicrostroma glucosiphilum TaxID=1684307 RepID=A0A316UFV8_9BASI|nr:hypothetical protein BCV69DRAFT_21047 [Pseudomicrostroma glucosiphilum]PWN24136.1 hypothetical protein BCV69DRAFT_21047 [Pseudomicrostroma glucosiphilum]